MAKFQFQETKSLATLIDEAHEAKQEPPRRHLGCSLIGHHCDRWIWLSFRWAVVEKFPGRLLRLFRRGHNEEQTIKEDLEGIGVVFESEQDRVNFGWFLEGSTDGIVTGVPGAEKTRHLLEDKTHSKKSFDELVKKGVQKAKPQHYAQMQIYMHGTGKRQGVYSLGEIPRCDRALYYAVCKDDDRVHTERIHYDRETAEALVKRGHYIAQSQRMPEPMAGGGPSWYQCKWCPAYDLCWKGVGSTENSCRTCVSWKAQASGVAWCNLHREDLGEEDGCPQYEKHPDLIPVENLTKKKRGLF